MWYQLATTPVAPVRNAVSNVATCVINIETHLSKHATNNLPVVEWKGPVPDALGGLVPLSRHQDSVPGTGSP